MPSKAEKRARRRQSVDRLERVGPTPETAAKLQPDPFNVLVEKGLLDTAQRDAGLEIRAIWYAITGGLMPKAGERSATRSGEGMSDYLAAAHAQVYLPWCLYWGRLVDEVIDLVVDARLSGPAGRRRSLIAGMGEMPTKDDVLNIGAMLEDYARRRRALVVSPKRT